MVTSSPSLVMPRLRQTSRSAIFAAGAAAARTVGRLTLCRESPLPAVLIFTPVSVFRRAANFFGGDAVGRAEEEASRSGVGVGCKSAGGRAQKRGSGRAIPRPGTRSSARPAGRPSSSACRRARGEVGVRCREPQEGSGGVGDASKPGGRAGESWRSGRCMETRDQSSMRAGLLSCEAAIVALIASRLEVGGVRRTVVGDSGGEAGGVRASLERRLALLGRACLAGLRPRSSTCASGGLRSRVSTGAAEDGAGMTCTSSRARASGALVEPEPRRTGAITGVGEAVRRRPSRLPRWSSRPPLSWPRR